jgi:hypothetical protein
MDDLTHERKLLANAPDLSLQQYIKQLADKKDTSKLTQLNQATYF